jgi:hypothetical protein
VALAPPLATATLPADPDAVDMESNGMESNGMESNGIEKKKGRYIEYSIFKSLYSLRIVLYYFLNIV